MKLLHYIIISTLSFLSIGLQNAQGQLGFCTGNSGDPIFTENFGAGTTNGPALASSITTYRFTTGAPLDGSYTISSNTAYFDWHDTQDHTPNDTDGKALIVNASFTTGEFYTRRVAGLCENTSYEFSSWLLNLLPSTTACLGGGLPINVNFQIWDDTDTNLLASGDTGRILGTATPNWQQYGLVFNTLPGQTSVILKMTNNGIGGCGNDVAIDDIVFAPCGDFVSLTNDSNQNQIAQCLDNGPIVSTQLTAIPDFSIYTSHAYQWQESFDGFNWTDIIGQTQNTYSTPILADSRFFRVKVAEDAINLSNAQCIVVSDVFKALILPPADPPVSNGNIIVCPDALRPLTVTVPGNQIVNWYDAPLGGNLLIENSTSFTPSASGTYYAAASSALSDCFSATTPLNYAIDVLPMLSEENVSFCENVPITLKARISNVSYLWSTGETTENIVVNEPGLYSMTATTKNDCSVTKKIAVEQIDQAVISTIISKNDAIIVSLTNPGGYEYALNNGPFQDSPVFERVRGGLYTINIRGANNCAIPSQDFHHFVVPKFFSPNGDSINDVFLMEGLEFFSAVEVRIFNRYGALIKQSNSTSFRWNGTHNGRVLPPSDYWYVISADNRQFKGHFTLKR